MNSSSMINSLMWLIRPTIHPIKRSAKRNSPPFLLCTDVPYNGKGYPEYFIVAG